jgi:hypothetical protein
VFVDNVHREHVSRDVSCSALAAFKHSTAEGLGREAAGRHGLAGPHRSRRGAVWLGTVLYLSQTGGGSYNARIPWGGAHRVGDLSYLHRIAVPSVKRISVHLSASHSKS